MRNEPLNRLIDKGADRCRHVAPVRVDCVDCAGAPYKLSDTEISLIFLVYLFGMVSSGVAGALSDRHGRGPVLIAGIAIAGIGVGLTLLQPVTAIICGVALVTIGFFIGHPSREAGSFNGQTSSALRPR
jgi:YNFM family putative membrane transporter